MRRRLLRHLAAVLLAALACDAGVTPPVEVPVLALSARDVAMFAPSGSVTPDRARVIVYNNGGGTLDGLAIGAPVYESVGDWLTATLVGDTVELAASAQALPASTRATATLDVFLAGAPDAPRTVTIVFEVGLTQRIRLSADSLTFVAISALGTVPPPQTVTVQNAGTGILTELATPEISPASAEAWLAAVIDDSTAPARVQLRLVPAGLPAPGEYAATVVVSSRVAEPERDSVAVALIVAPPVSPVVSADSLFIDVVQGAGPVTRHVRVDEVSRRPLSADVASDAAWLTAAPDPVVTPGLLAIVASAAGLAPGAHVGRVTLSAGSGSTTTVVVVLRIRPGPAIALGVDGVRFTTYRGGPVPDAQVVRVENAGDGSLAGLGAQVQPDAGWLTVPVPTPDTAPAQFTVAIDPTSAAWQAILASGGTETREVVMSATGAAAVTLPVTLDVRDGPALELSSTLVRFHELSDTAGSGTLDDSVEVAVTNAGPATLTGLQVAVTYQDSSGWLAIPPGPLATPAALRLRPLTRLPAGTYRATVSVFSAVDSAAVAVEYTSVDSLDTADLTLASSDTVELWSNSIGGTQPRAILWFENASSGDITLSASPPGWLSAAFTESNRRTPTGLVLQVERDPSDTAGVYATTLLVTGTVGGATVPPVPIRVRLVMAGPALTTSADAVTLRTWERRTSLPTQPVIVSNDATGALSGVRVTSAPTWLVAEPTTASPAPTAILLRARDSLTAGPYAGTVTIASSVATNSPITLPVSLTVDPGPSLAASPDTVALTSIEGDTIRVEDTVVAFNAGKGVLGALAAPVVAPAGEWLTAAWDTGGTAANPPQLIIRANPRGLPPTTTPRVGTITLDSPDPGSAMVHVLLDVAPAPTLRRSPAVLTFTATEGLPLPADTQTIAVFDPEGRPTGPLDVTVSGDTSWFAWDLDATGVPAAIRVWPITVPRASDSAYAAVVTVTGGTRADTVRSVLQYDVAQPERPVILVSRDTLVFERVDPLAQTVEITNGGSGTLRELSVADVTGTDWLFVLLDNRIAPAKLTVAVNATAAADEPANSVATLRITGEDAEPKTITVILR